MIRQTVTAGIVAGALALSSCASTGGFVPPTVQSVYQAVLNGCAFQASAPELQALITAAIPGLTTVAAIATEVCDLALAAAAKTSAKLRGANAQITVTVGGFPITGKFVQ